MEHISEIIDDILTEWAYQVNDGMPDVDNPLHMAQLEHSLNDLEFPPQFIVEFMSNLREKDDEGGLDPDELEKAKNKGLVHLGGGSWGKKGGKPTHASQDGKLVHIDKDEDEKETKKGMTMKAKPYSDDEKTDSDGKPKKKETKTQRKSRENGEQHQKDQKVADKVHNDVYGETEEGQILDEGKGNNDSKVKQNMLTHGYKNQKEKTGKDPAPGNEGSAFNEIVSGEGAKILRTAEEKGHDLNEQQLAKIIAKQFCGTALGIENSKGTVDKKGKFTPKTVANNTKDIPNDVDKGCYEKSLIAAKSAIRKHERAKKVKENLGKEGTGQLEGETTTTEFYGADDSINAQVAMIEEAETVLAPDGSSIPKESIWNPAAPKRDEGESYKDYHKRVKIWAKENNAERVEVGALDMAMEGGGGANPSDTATFILDENGTLVMAFTSDKMDTNDIQANSTLVFEINQKIQWINDDPSLTDDEKEKLTTQLDNQKNEIEDIEKGLKGTLTTAASNLKNEDASAVVKMLAEDTLVDGTKDKKNGRGTKKHWKKVKTAHSGPFLKKDGTMSAKKKSQLYYLPQEGIEGDTQGYYPRKEDSSKTKAQYYNENQPTDEDIYNALMSKAEKDSDNLKDYEMKVIERTASRLREHHKNQPGDESKSKAADYDISAKAEQVRRDTVAANRRHRKELNEVEITTESGKKMGLGDYLEAKNLSDKLHLGQIDKATAHGVYKHDGLMEVNMGGVVVNPEVLRKCLNVQTEGELIDNFEVGAPEDEDELTRSTDEHETDDDGNLFYWAVNNDGEYTSDDDGNPEPSDPEDTGEITTDITKAGKKPKKVGRVTGRNVFIYAVTKDNKRYPIAKKVIRSKTGKLGKLQTVYQWSPEIQKCFKDEENTAVAVEKE
tara:strand:- start:832 stop:3510 length:2679 start_codon:yes stop_codon:yes gene_type:complete